ncbi:MAG: ABC transporter ATP-binding protein [Anaerolineaceae bacterium]|nr:ABC transporter ATP-binding protein [Anaerolineaceae bacterium]
MENDILLEADHIQMTFPQKGGGLHVLEDISLTLKKEEFVCIIGPSGSGKSTLVRILGGLLEPTGGKLIYPDGKEPDPRAVVFQNSNLLPWLHTVDNVALPLLVKGVPKKEALAEAESWLDLFGLGGFANEWPNNLSGGMAQRVAIARALIQKPQLLLMDEPLGALDAMTREQISLELMAFRERIDATVLMVTHSISEALLLSDRILIYSGRPARIIDEMKVPFPRPRTPELRDTVEFLAMSKMIRKKIFSQESGVVS